MKLADKHDAFENISNNRRVEHHVVFFFLWIDAMYADIKFVMIYLPRKVV